MAGTLQQSSRRRLSPWSGFGSLGRLRDEMEDMFGRFTSNGGDDWPSPMLAPPMDLSETDGGLQIRLDLPGVDPKKIDIQVSGNQLTISGERKEEQEEKGETFHRIERVCGCFSRSVRLPCAVEEGKIDANYQDGVLTVSVPKSQACKARRIEVKTK